LFESRPSDLISFVASKNVFSDVLYAEAIDARMLAHADSLSLTASYGLHLAAGTFINAGLTYVDHPTSITYTPKTGSALVVQGNLSLIF
jgi:porin